jgi:hypothetical protein
MLERAGAMLALNLVEEEDGDAASQSEPENLVEYASQAE